MSASLLGCGSDDSRPGVMPGIPKPIKPSTPTNPSNPSNPTNPPTDSGNPPSEPIEPASVLLSGIYTGITGQGEIAQGLVDDNKRIWVVYSDNLPDVYPLGFVSTNQNIVGNSGEFSVNGKNYSYDDRSAFDVTITGDYKTAKTIKGRIFDVPSRSTTYEVDYDDALSARKQSLAAINKVFTGIAYITGDTDAGELVLDVKSNGSFTGEDESGCRMSGKFTLATSQRYFDSTVTFGGAPCFAPRETITGVALLDENNELIVIGTDANRSKGIYFSGEE